MLYVQLVCNSLIVLTDDGVVESVFTLLLTQFADYKTASPVSLIQDIFM